MYRELTYVSVASNVQDSSTLMIDQCYINEFGILPTIGAVNTRGRRGVPLRTSKHKEALRIPRRAIEMFIGLIDGDGYIAINRTST